MPTPTQPWLRAELIAAPETAPGAQLMIPADGIEFHDDQLVFHRQGDVVYVAPQGQLRSITWFARQPHPETARRKAQWPNHGTRWTDEERTNLRGHLQSGHTWKAISHAHGRSRTGCQQEAVKQGWLDAETLAPTPKLLGGEAPEVDSGTQATGKPDATLAAAPADPATITEVDTAASDSPPRPRRAKASVDAQTSAALAVTAASAWAPSNIGLATALTDPPPSPQPAGPSSDPPPYTSAPAAPPPPATLATPAPAADPAAVPPNFALAADTADAADYANLTQAAVAIAREATARTDTEGLPDRPRIPRQRSDSADTPPAPDPEKDAPPGPGSRFLSRAQSSLARAALGPYLNPPRAT